MEPVSVSGAGDSFLGAMVSRLAHDDGLDSALRYGVAGGSAALLSPGTGLCPLVRTFIASYAALLEKCRGPRLSNREGRQAGNGPPGRPLS